LNLKVEWTCHRIEMIDTTGNPLIVCNFMRNWYYRAITP
jgi:hypothetical protein